MRNAHSGKRGIVAVKHEPAATLTTFPLCNKEKMRACLNALGWDKVIVNFGGLLPVAHLQICANERWPPWLAQSVGISAGHEVMDDTAGYICRQHFVSCVVEGELMEEPTMAVRLEVGNR